jgi:hypothetical protein
VPRRSWPSGWRAGRSTPMSTASASSRSTRQPAGDDRPTAARLAPARPRPGR